MHPESPEGSQGRILELLKRRGPASIPDLSRALELNPETIRAHVRALDKSGLLEGVDWRSEGPGRPERIFALTRRAEALFPRRESELLKGLASYLREVGREDVLASFLERFATQRRDAALQRLEGLEGPDRLAEVARILTEEGYMAEIRADDADVPRLRLCHCPVRELVDVTRAPCKAEIGFVQALVGEGMARVEYIPDGDQACAYALAGDGGPEGEGQAR